MCTVVCPCNKNDKAKWEGLTAADLKTFKRLPYSEDLTVAAAEAIDAEHVLFFSDDTTLTAPMKTYASWKACYDEMQKDPSADQ